MQLSFEDFKSTVHSDISKSLVHARKIAAEKASTMTQITTTAT
jgi:hypothetical protein